MVKAVSNVPNLDDIASFTVSGAAGDFIFKEGDAGKDMYIIQEGRIEILNQYGGKSRELGILEVGDFFGELSLLEDQRRDASAHALTTYRLLRIDRTTLNQLVQENPDIAVRMLHRLASRLREHEEALLRANEIAASALKRPPSPPVAAVPSEPAAAPKAEAPSAPVQEVPRPAPRMVVLVHPASGKEFPLPEAAELIVGRIDRASGFTPDLDLSSLDTDRTLSRRHVTIVRRDGALFLREAKATGNGTFVNGRRIGTGVDVRLSDGDKVRFGLIETEVRER
jgi:hypothetical protein